MFSFICKLLLSAKKQDIHTDFLSIFLRKKKVYIIAD